MTLPYYFLIGFNIYYTFYLTSFSLFASSSRQWPELECLISPSAVTCHLDSDFGDVWSLKDVKEN